MTSAHFPLIVDAITPEDDNNLPVDDGSSVSLNFSDVSVLSRNTIRIRFVDEMVVDNVYLDPSSYSITVTQGPGGDIRVLSVLPTSSLSSLDVILVTDNFTVGTLYRVTYTNLVNRAGVPDTGSISFYARDTKTSAMLNSLPNHYDKRPQSTLASVLTGISLEDEIIGGSRHDDITNIEAVIRPDAPTVTIDLATPDKLCPDSTPHGNYTDAVRIAVLINDVPAGDATLSSAGEWDLALPVDLLTDGVPATLRVVAVGPGGYVEELALVDVDLVTC